MAAHMGTLMRSKRIIGVAPRDDTIIRIGRPSGGFQLTWGAHDQFVAVCDSANMVGPPKQAFRACLYTLKGGPENPTFAPVPAYPATPMRVLEHDRASFCAGNCLAVDGAIYQFLMTPTHPYLKPDRSFAPGFRPLGCKLIYSRDGGRHWANQDGSEPVTWETWQERSRSNMAFLDEHPAGAFASPTFLQMGRDYKDNEDGYVYVYSSNGDVDGDANQLVLFRSPKDKIVDRTAYEFFGGPCENGCASWTRDITRRAPVCTFPEGWVSSTDHGGAAPLGWSAQIVYNAPLKLYMLVAQGTGVASHGGWFGKPSYLGFWTAPSPWGPFTQIHEATAWTPGDDTAARAFLPQIAPKWIADDGRSFWLVWSDYQFRGQAGEIENPDRSFLEVVRDITDDSQFARILVEWTQANMPRTGFNMQRFDLLFE